MSIALEIDEDRKKRHLYLLGASGAGKSEFMSRMFAADAQGGRGACFIDPHGESERLLDHIPEERVPHTYFLEPGRYPLSLNPFASKRTGALVSNVTGLFKRILSEDGSWGNRMGSVLRYSIRSLADIPGATLLDLRQMLQSESYREEHMFRFSAATKEFWLSRFKGPLFSTSVEALLDRLDPLTEPLLSPIFGGLGPSLDLRELMDQRALLVINLRPDNREESQILGAVLVAMIQDAALSRSDVPRYTRQPFYLYVDEFQTFMGGPFDQILAESYKFGLHLAVAHQYLDQLDKGVYAAIKANTRTRFYFTLDPDDATHLKIPTLPRYTAAIRGRVTNGSEGDDKERVLTFTTSPLPRPETSHADKIRMRMRSLAPLPSPAAEPTPIASSVSNLGMGDIPSSPPPGKGRRRKS